MNLAMFRLQIYDRLLESVTTRRWFTPVVAGLLLGAALWVMTRAWDASLLDRYQFRQTQTALTAYWMQHDGFQLAYPLPVFGPPWSVPFEFPLYQWLVALLTNATGLSLVSAARLVGITFFLLTLPAVYGLAGLVERDPRRRLLVPAAVLVAPICLFYARTFMIESCATALAVWYLYAQVRNLQRLDWRWTTATAVLGMLAALVKITTFALFGAAAAAYTLYRIVQAIRRPAGPAAPGLPRLLLASVIPAMLALVAGMGGVKFTDAIKHANPYAEIFTSVNLKPWLYGPLAQRWDPAFWAIVAHQLSVGVLSVCMLLLLAVALFVVAPSYRRAALCCAPGFFLGPLFFSNLHAIHEYYYFPSAVFAAGAAGIVLAGILETPRLGTSVKTLVLLAFFGMQAANFNRDYAITLRHQPPAPPPLAEIVRQSTPTDGIVLIYGWDWNTLIPYYAGRRAILVPSGREDNADMLLAILSKLPPLRVSAMVIKGPLQADPSFIKWHTSQLNLSSTPVARSPDGVLYLPAPAISALFTALTDRALYPDVELDFPNSPERSDPRLHCQKVNPAAYAGVASPSPFAVFTPWTIDVALLAGQPAIFANAPSELHFHAPAGATHLTAIVGLNEAAYAGPTPTDGVDVVIFELQAGGGRRVLYQRNLNPVLHPEDRGPQSIAIEAIGPVAGPLVFAIYPGPADNMACDWGYWRHIKIH